ncbi:MAG: 4-hydroxyphenylpyruvate dioxygenase [Leptolyngbya sp. SIO4C1]|nr:4-hydroxyphenylpyruvate dioxygenase [Leptolyngbya sp. SIO4C1]
MKSQSPFLKIDYLEFYVGNAKQAAVFYQQQFGFAITAFRGLETGEQKTASYVLRQGEICFVLSSALCPDHPVGQAVARHGDGVGAIALSVADAQQTYRRLVERGAVGVIPPTTVADSLGQLRFAAIRGYGETLLKLVDRGAYRGVFAPGFVAQTPSDSAPTAGLVSIDHVVGNVARGEMDRWVKFFIDVMGFELLVHFDDSAISTPFSALMSKVVQTPDGAIKLPINEPALAQRRSQIEEYLEFYDGPGVQHIALSTRDIIATVKQLQAAGVAFLPTPPTYYETLAERVGPIAEPIEQLAELGILADRDGSGYLLQIFTQPVQDRPTLFFEIIQRCGATGFGEGNFKALFEAIEREQARRGNL